MKPAEAKKKLGLEYEERLNEFVLKNPERVIRTARPDYSSVGQSVRV